jgi:glutamyl-tRNA reductase
MRLSGISVSHRRAPVALRERLHMGSEEARAVALRLAAAGCETVVLATCNRTEIYLACSEPEAAAEQARAELAGIAGLTRGELDPVLETRRDRDAAGHLFRVAAGLESLVPGESQILGQIRDAYSAALDNDTSGPLLNRLFHRALEAGKRVRTETAIGEKPASVAGAAADLARRGLGGLAGRRILIVGAGKTSALTAGAFVSHGAGVIVVASRTRQQAFQLAQRLGGEAIGLDCVESELERADVVISATASPTPLLTAAQVAQAMPARAGRPLLLIDIAVPRDLDPAIRSVDGCRLYDIDDLQSLVAESVAGRRQESHRAEAIVAGELEKFARRQRTLEIAPVIESLTWHAQAIRTAALANAMPKLVELSARERATVETLTAQIVSRLIHPAIARLKSASEDGNANLYTDAVVHLFGLAKAPLPKATTSHRSAAGNSQVVRSGVTPTRRPSRRLRAR